MRRTLISFVAVYALVLGATSCGGGGSGTSPFAGPVPGGGNGGGGAPSGPPSTAGYIQIERLARPAIKEATENFMDHDATNRVSPDSAASDAKLAASISNFVANVAGRDATHVTTLVNTLIPDEMAADLSQTTPAAYLAYELKGYTSPTGSTFGGRSLVDDVIDIDLGAIFGKALTAATNGAVPDDGKSSPCLTTDNVPSQAAADNITLTTFPYVGTPH